MSMHRLTLNLTEAEKRRIEREAAALGMSASDYVRKAVELLDADDIRAIDEFRPLLPEFNAALARIEENLAAAADRREKRLQEIERMRTPEYREEVRRSIMEDSASMEAVAALADSPGKISKTASRVRETRDPWGEGEAPAEGKPSK